MEKMTNEEVMNYNINKAKEDYEKSKSSTLSISDIMNEVKKKVLRGYNSTSLFGRFSDSDIEALKNLGYSVDIVPYKQGLDCLTISGWNKKN
jgi:hypothetical protein